MREIEKVLMVYGGLKWCIDNFEHSKDLTRRKYANLHVQLTYVENLLIKKDMDEILECCQKDIYSLL